MKVLLISPKDPDQPEETRFLMGGENTYTRALLENPPPGVAYTHYQTALKEGKIAYTPYQKMISLLMKTQLWPPDAGSQCLKIKGKFDLIHCHAYVARFENYHGPVVLSDSSSNYCFLKDYLGWSLSRIKWHYRFRQFICQKFALYDPNLNLTEAKKLIVWSDFAKEVHQAIGADPKKIVVIPPGIEKLPKGRAQNKNFNILFVGVWFERKGGCLLLDAFRVLSRKYTQVKLYLVGGLPRDVKLPAGVWHQSYLPRETLTREVFPIADVLVLVPPLAEGYGLVVLEAASLGIPAIVSSVYALPQIVLDQQTGFVVPPNNLKALINRLEILLKDRVLLARLGRAAEERFEKEFSINQTNKKLLKVYQEAVET